MCECCGDCVVLLAVDELDLSSVGKQPPLTTVLTVLQAYASALPQRQLCIAPHMCSSCTPLYAYATPHECPSYIRHQGGKKVYNGKYGREGIR